MANINPTDPRTFKSDAIRANRLSAKCDGCDERVIRSSLISLKTGQSVCTTCFDAIIEWAFEDQS